MRVLFSAIIAAASAVPASGHAEAVVDVLTVSGSGFSDISGGAAAAPFDPASITFRVSFDPALGDVFDDVTDITRIGGGLVVAGGLGFDYDSTLDMLTVGGAGLSGIGIAAGTNDVLAVVDDASAAPAFDALIYATSASPGLYEAASGTVTGTVEVPEPSTIGLLAAGGVLALRRRRRVA